MPIINNTFFCNAHSTNLFIHCSVTPGMVVFLDNTYLQDLVIVMHYLCHLLFLDCPFLIIIQTAIAVTEFLLVYPTQLLRLKRILLVCRGAACEMLERMSNSAGKSLKCLKNPRKTKFYEIKYKYLCKLGSESS